MIRIYKAFFYSLHGLIAAFKNEAAFRQEIILSMILIPFAFFPDVSLVEKILLISSVILVMIVELLNSAVEAVVDRISKEKHDLSKIAKDTASAAVMLSVINVMFVWVLVFGG